MVELADIRSLSDFQRNTREHLRHLKRRGAPLVLTVNGKAELVVQDARSYQKLLDLLEEAEVVVTLRKRLASLGQGTQGRSFEDALEDLRRRYETPRKR
jgi:PHD/YefM family antitoxin component YafN of YafNO toxin-antitoxin module